MVATACVDARRRGTAVPQLHSHEVPYGSGSGQQSVTGYPENDDTNSYFVVMGPHGQDCERGNPIACGSALRLRVRPAAARASRQRRRCSDL